ncbi:hypothetical protein WJX73_007332 [Symbiochloris irregularis]|uniref:Uncharacterized protein n=1 Tax=Symbiochloris irregularis TaxID=706552 RepID=A0AAW1P8E1_9CHLO
MISEETLRLLLKVQQAAKVVIPVLLSIDMVHNVYYVRNLWMTRLREWRAEEDVRTCVQISQICQHMVQKCHTNHKDLWPAILAPAAAASVQLEQHAQDAEDKPDDGDFLFELGMVSRSQPDGLSVTSNALELVLDSEAPQLAGEASF